MNWLWIVGAYSIGLTILFVWIIFRQYTRSKILIREAHGYINEGMKPIEKIKALTELAKIDQGTVTWFERSVSTIGVVAFFSMIFATGIQTIKATLSEMELEKLKQEVTNFQKQSSDIENLLGDMAKGVVDQFQRKGKLDPLEIQILRRRLERIEYRQEKTQDDLIEIYQTAIVLRDFEKAIGVLEANWDLFKSAANPIDQIILAEYYFLTGHPKSAKRQIQEILPKTSILPVQWQFKVIILNAILQPEMDLKHFAREVAALYMIDLHEGLKRLQQELEVLKEASKGYKKTP